MKQQEYIGRIFIKMPQYIQQWLKSKYQDSANRLAPVPLPWAGHPAGQIIFTRLIPNERMKKLTPICFSDEMYNMALDNVPPEFLDRFPAADQRSEFIAIAVPPPHFYDGRWIAGDRYWQLSGEDTRELNRHLSLEFFDDISNYWEQWSRNFSINNPNRRPTFWDALMDFMELYRIDFALTDALYREITRKKKLIKSLNTVK